jgi:poly-gamma-glutamate capsule biosynthesis protein CapA/YwtB (metallophosphatase superfamily)
VAYSEVTGTTKQKQMNWTAFFAGDIYADSSARKLLSADVQQFVTTHDVVSCNFEAPIADVTDTAIKKAGPLLRHGESAANAVLSAGFNVINLSNNHMFDYEAAALERTIQYFSSVLTCGAGSQFQQAYGLKIKQVKTVKVGFLSFAEWGFGAMDGSRDVAGYAWINHPSVNTIVSDARRKCDVLFIQAHAGVEEIPLPLPEWRIRYKQLIGLGADAVIAHHPHTMQGWELHNGKPIFYSLGNFSFDSDSPTDEWNRSYGVTLHFDGTEFKKFDIVPFEKTTAGVVFRTPEAGSLEKLCADLSHPAYEKEIDRICLQLWEERYKPYYELALNSLSSKNPTNVLRRVKAWVLNTNVKQRNLLLLHNLRIESHRYCAERALRLLTGY